MSETAFQSDVSLNQLEAKPNVQGAQPANYAGTHHESKDKSEKSNTARLYLSTAQRFWVLWYISRAQGMLNVAEEDIGFKVCRKTRELLEANKHRHNIARNIPNNSLKRILRHAHKSESIEPVYKKTGRPKVFTCRDKVKELLEERDMSTRSIAIELSKNSDIPISRETVRKIAKDVLRNSTTSKRK